MSAYVVSDKTINTIIAGLITANENGYFGPLDLFYRNYNENLKFKKENAEQIGNMLLDLNIFSVEQRYKRGDSMTKNRDLFVYDEKTPTPDMYHFIKALSCYLYQSCEGLARDTKLFNDLYDMRNRIAYVILNKSERYMDAPGWE